MSDQKIPQGAHTNFMGGVSYKLRSAVTQLQIMAASSFFGEPAYYVSGDGKPKKDSGVSRVIRLSSDQQTKINKTLGGLLVKSSTGTVAEQMEAAIDRALDEDPEGTLQLAVRLRHQDHIRKTPQVIMVRASRHPKVRETPGLLAKYAPHIMARADEPAVQKAYFDARFGRAKYPNALKGAWAKYLGTLTEYQVAKYRNAEKKAPLVSVVNVCHPKGNPVLGKLVKGEVTLSEEDTWEALISKKGSSKETWAQAVPLMGHMALLRNLRNLLSNGVAPDLFLEKLVKTAQGGKQLPFRYYSAYRACHGQPHADKVAAALDECLKESLGMVPHFKGKSMSLCDNSGSAWGAVTSSMGSVTAAEIANLSAIITALASDEGHVGLFGDTLKEFPVKKDGSILKQLAAANSQQHTIGGGTEHGVALFWTKAIRDKEHWDNVFVYSDMQAGHGGLYGTGQGYKDFIWSGAHMDVAKMVSVYRETVNPKVNVILCQVAGYGDTLLPDTFYRTAILGGWGEGILQYADQMTSLFDGIDANEAQGG